MTTTVVREPLFRSAPDCRDSFGDLACKIGVEIGLPPDDEQRAALDAIFAERAPNEPAARHAAIVGARQNIKTSTLVIAAATDLLVLQVQGAVWTAHLSSTASKSYQDLQQRLTAHPDYGPLVAHLGGRGEQSIFLRDDPTVAVEYRARAGGGGRGFTTSRLTLDEALFLRAGDMGALLPTMLTRKDAQVRYGSSGGFVTSEVLRGLRTRAHDGSDPRLFYVEYGAERRPCADDNCSHRFGQVEGCALDDRELWWQANCALWAGRIEEENILDLRRSMPAEEFAREVLVWWDEPVQGSAVGLDMEMWLAGLDIQADPSARRVLAVSSDQDARYTSICAGWVRPDGRVQVALQEWRRGRAWVRAAIADLRSRRSWDVLEDGAARGMVPGADSKVHPVVAHNALDTAVRADMVRHNGDGPLNVAAGSAVWRMSGQSARTLVSPDGTDITPILAAAQVVQHLLAEPEPSQSGPPSFLAATRSTSPTSDVMSAGF